MPKKQYAAYGIVSANGHICTVYFDPHKSDTGSNVTSSASGFALGFFREYCCHDTPILRHDMAPDVAADNLFKAPVDVTKPCTVWDNPVTVAELLDWWGERGAIIERHGYLSPINDLENGEEIVRHEDVPKGYSGYSVDINDH